MTSWGSIDVMNPASTAFLNAACEKATFGWPCDPEMEKLRAAFANETDPARQKAIAEAVQLRAAEVPTHVHLGQYVQPTAYRKSISGILKGGSTAFWNVDKQ
jgi:peptide/nickel transport system substrate-binding protein